MIEFPPKFAGCRPVGPLQEGEKQSTLVEDWSGVKGMAEDVRRYGLWMRSEAEKCIGHLYPKVEITPNMAIKRPDLISLVGEQLTVIAWLWARTVKSPNPAYSHVDVPLAYSFVLSSKKGKEAYVTPIINGDGYSFSVGIGSPPLKAEKGTTAGGHGANFVCLMSQSAIPNEYIKEKALAGEIGVKLMAIVAEGKHGRVYLSPKSAHEQILEKITATWSPDIEFFQQALGFRIGNYGIKKWSELFTTRQLTSLTVLSDMIPRVIEKCYMDAKEAGMSDDKNGLELGGKGATAYAEAIGAYLALVNSRCADWNNILSRWESKAQVPQQLFGRQTISMVWGFSEANILSSSTGSFIASLNNLIKSFSKSSVGSNMVGHAELQDAVSQSLSQQKIVSTDPPYYDNIGYADLSDFFYVWLRKALKNYFPGIFSTMVVPKIEELVATPRHGDKAQAETFFIDGMTKALKNLVTQYHPAFPLTLYYAFKQSETVSGKDITNSGWETFLKAIINAGFVITGTWPLSTENVSRLRGQESNALASSIVLVCRKRSEDAPTVSRREFIRELNTVLPDALDEMTRGGINSPVAPVDLSQAIIGPGMAIFSRYTAVLEADGTPMTVRTALQLINRFFAEDDFDHDTQFCLSWFENTGWSEGQFGQADVLSRSKGTSVAGLQAAGVAQSSSGNFRLLRWAELPADWSPVMDKKASVWEGLHQLIRALNQEGEATAGKLLAGMPALAESMRALAYRLYTLCERKGWAEEARAYNELVGAWAGIEQVSYKVGHVGTQTELDL